MSGLYLALGCAFGVLAAAIHVLIFLLESVLWRRPQIWRRFGVKTAGDAEVLRPMAFNQGFYNLFLAIGASVGVILICTPGLRQAGFALAFLGLGSMLLAAVVLISSNPRLARAAFLQGTVPLLGLVFLFLAAR